MSSNQSTIKTTIILQNTYYINKDDFQNKHYFGGTFGGHFLKILMMSKCFRSLHLNATLWYLNRINIKNYIQTFFNLNMYHFQNKPHFGSHFGSHLEFLEILNGAKCNDIVCDKYWAIVSRIHWKQNNFYINIDYFHNKPRFGGHLVGHLEFLKTLNDASLASFRIFNTNMSSNKINNKKTIYSNAGLCQNIQFMDRINRIQSLIK